MNRFLRPLNIGETLDCTISLYRSKFWVFFGVDVIPFGILMGIIGCIYAPFIRFFVAISHAKGDPTQAQNITQNMAPSIFLTVAILYLLSIPVFIALETIRNAAITYCANRVYKEEPVTIRESFQYAWKHFWRHLRLQLSIWALWMAPLVVLGILAAIFGGLAALAGDSQGAVFGVMFLFLFIFYIGMIVYMFWIMIQTSLAFPACVEEQLDAWPSIKRAFRLVKGARGRLLLVIFLVAMTMYILVIPVEIIAFIAAAIVGALTSQNNVTGIAATMMCIIFPGMAIVLGLVQPLQHIAYQVVYYDRRIRTEALDIEWMMQHAGMEAPAIPAPSPENPAMFEPPAQWNPTDPYNTNTNLSEKSSEA